MDESVRLPHYVLLGICRRPIKYGREHRGSEGGNTNTPETPEPTPSTYTLIYTATEGGRIVGLPTQTVSKGANGLPRRFGRVCRRGNAFQRILAVFCGQRHRVRRGVQCNAGHPHQHRCHKAYRHCRVLHPCRYPERGAGNARLGTHGRQHLAHAHPKRK